MAELACLLLIFSATSSPKHLEVLDVLQVLVSFFYSILLLFQVLLHVVCFKSPFGVNQSHKLVLPNFSYGLGIPGFFGAILRKCKAWDLLPHPSQQP
jgi:hypothetical protein